MENRIYGRKVPINSESVRAFYDKRAADTGVDRVGAVLLGNQDPKFLNQRNDYDRENVLPLLNIGPETRVLDIGCGTGRMANFILPNCKFYCGVDFSEEMVKITKQVCQSRGGDYAAYCLSALEAADQNADFYGGRFGAVIAGGIFMYVNDQDAEHIFQRLPELLEEHSSVYLADPVGIQKRLTLCDFPSETLQTKYNGIYRTPEEYLDLCAPLLSAGFSVVKQGFRPTFGETYTDTGRYIVILQR